MTNTLKYRTLRERLGISRKQLNFFLREGLPRNEDGTFCPTAVSEWLLQNGHAKKQSGVIARTRADAARILGLSLRKFEEYAAEQGFPGRGGTVSAIPDAYYPIAEIRDWLARNHPKSPAGQSINAPPGRPAVSATTSARERYHELRAERAQFELDRQRGLYLDTDEVMRFYVRTVGYVGSVLNDLPAKINALLPEDTTDTIRNLIRSAVIQSVDQARTSIGELITGDQDDDIGFDET